MPDTDAPATGSGRAREPRRPAFHFWLLLPAAAAAGLREGDRVSAWQLHPDPQRECSLTVQRDGRSETIRFFPRGRRLAVVQFAPASPVNRSTGP
ncbi:MAG: hypothetical protein HUU27_03260 [Phycisphaerae bacterium]|nr:hypothetical protein [Phycisphaerae bacterium]